MNNRSVLVNEYKRRQDILLLILYKVKQECIQVRPLLVYNVISEEKPARVANKKSKVVITLTGDTKTLFVRTAAI
jgi:hypothetical protein